MACLFGAVANEVDGEERDNHARESTEGVGDADAGASDLRGVDLGAVGEEDGEGSHGGGTRDG